MKCTVVESEFGMMLGFISKMGPKIPHFEQCHSMELMTII